MNNIENTYLEYDELVEKVGEEKKKSISKLSGYVILLFKVPKM